VVLEAGCGSASHLRLDGVGRLVGIDLSVAQLERNAALDERVQGDVQTHRFPASSFDLVLVWDVLEHLDRPLAALDNLIAATRPGGLLVVAVPNLLSVKGIATRLTPNRVHEAVIRRVYPYWPDAEDVGPFPTRMRRSITPSALLCYAERRGLAIRRALVYESEFQQRVRSMCRLEGGRWRTLRRAVTALSAGRVTASGSDLLLVLQAPGKDPA
jgi:SAM-dependent methyltransferase